MTFPAIFSRMLNSGSEKSRADATARTNWIDENAFEQNQASHSRGLKAT